MSALTVTQRTLVEAMPAAYSIGVDASAGFTKYLDGTTLRLDGQKTAFVKNVDLISPNYTYEGDPGATIGLYGTGGARLFRIAANNITFRNLIFEGGRPMDTNSGKGAQVVATLSSDGKLTSVQVLYGGSGYSGSSFTYTVTDNNTTSDKGTITFTVGTTGTATGVIQSGTVTYAGSGYTADHVSTNPALNLLTVGRQSNVSLIDTDTTAMRTGLTFENCIFRYARNGLDISNATDVRILDCIFEDQGPNASAINLSNTSRAIVRGNRIYRPAGGAFNGSGIRVTSGATADVMGVDPASASVRAGTDSAVLIEDILITGNLCEGAIDGGGIVTNVANVKRLSIVGNICRDNSSKQIEIKAGVNPAATTPLNDRGLTEILIADNICTSTIGNAPVISLIQNNPARYEIAVRGNFCAFDTVDDLTKMPTWFRQMQSSSAAIRLSGANGVSIEGNVIRRAFRGITFVNNCQNIRAFGNDIEARRGILGDSSDNNAALRGIWTSGNRIRAIETGIDFEVGTGIRCIGDDIEIAGDFVSAVTVTTPGSGYTSTTPPQQLPLYAIGSGEAALVTATANSAGGIASALVVGTAAEEIGFGYLGGGSASAASGLGVPVLNGGGSGATLRFGMTSGVPDPGAATVTAAGAGYLDKITGATFAVAMPEGAQISATTSGGQFTSPVTVINPGSGFRAKPTLDTRAFGSGSGAAFAVTMGSETGTGLTGIRLGAVVGAQVRNCTIRSWQKGIEIGYDLASRMICHDVEITRNSIRTQIGEPIVLGGGFGVRVHDNDKYRGDGAAPPAQTIAASATSKLASFGNYADSETITIGSRVYTLTSGTPASADQIHVAATEAITLANIHHAVNASGGTPGTDYSSGITANTQVSATDDGAHILTLTALAAGAAGNGIATACACASAFFSGPATQGAETATAIDGDVVVLPSIANQNLSVLLGGTPGQVTTLRRTSTTPLYLTVTPGGNIKLPPYAPFLMADQTFTLTLRYDGANWLPLSPNPPLPLGNALALAIVNAYATPPPVTYINALADLILTLMASGTWSKLDALYNLSTYDAQQARINLVSPGFATLGEVSTGFIFTPLQGYAGYPANSAYLTSGVPIASLGKFSQNNGAMFVWPGSDDSDNNYYDIGTTTSLRAVINAKAPVMGSGGLRTYANQTSSDTYSPVSDARKLVGFSRSNATGYDQIYDGVIVASPAKASASITGDFCLFQANAANYSARRLRMAGVGAALSATDWTTLKSGFTTFWTAIGAA